MSPTSSGLCNSLFSLVLQAAKMMVYLEPSSDKMACEIATALDESLSGKSIQVCDDVLNICTTTHLLVLL